MRVMITGGGTGGHVFPGIAVADEFVDRFGLDISDILFVGTEHGIESKVVPKAGYPIRFVPSAGFVGMNIPRRLVSLLKLGLALANSRKLIKEMRPDIVIGTGGYASIGPVLTAYFMKIPTMILEQNVVPGLANKTLARFCDAVALTYHESIRYFPMEKTHLTGNPVRREIMRADKKTACSLFSLEEERFTVFIFGGSKGAQNINRAVVESLPLLEDMKEKVQFLHQTGEKDFESVKEVYRKSGFRGTVAPFIHQMPEAYAVADIVVSRAGATTLAELTALGKPSVIVPYPFALGHQEYNAAKLRDTGAGRLILDAELNGDRLSKVIREIAESAKTRDEMRKQSLALGQPDAAKKVVDIAASLISVLKKTDKNIKRGE